MSQGELARLPMLPCFLIFLLLSLALYQPASVYVYSTSCMSSLITFNHTYLKCIFIFTYILYADKLSAERLRLGRHWNGKSVLPLTLTVQSGWTKKKKKASRSAFATNPRNSDTWFQSVGQCHYPTKSYVVFSRVTDSRG